MGFKAFWVEKSGSGFKYSVSEREVGDLPAGEVLIDVRFSSLNYKDALSATGNPGVTRNFPHTPGIDAAGVVLESHSPDFKVGQQVLVMGYDLGMNTPGGYGQRIRVPANWVVSMPAGLTPETSMHWGTAGFTAALAIEKLLHQGMTPGGGPVVVTGASGGVGCVAVRLLHSLGFAVTAVTGKPEQHAWLRKLGASDFISRQQALEGADRPLGKERWGGAVDTVGGMPLANVVKSLKHSASVAVCGLAASAEFPITVLPFILRHVNVLGVDSVELPIEHKRSLWNRIGGEWCVDLRDTVQMMSLRDLEAAVPKILAGGMVGRGVVDLYR
jgi:acrylyl-CoA reductase (NADPH)